MEHTALLARLRAQAEPEYAAFSAALVPGCAPMLGVRLPALRRLARELAGDLPAALAVLPGGDARPAEPPCFEEQALLGLTLAYAPLPDGERRMLLEERWLPLLAADGNWSLCDSAAATCRWMTRAPAYWLPWLRALAADGREFVARFGLVCLLDHFTADPAGRRLTLTACAAAACPAPYVRLAVAWAVCEVTVREPSAGLEFLSNSNLDEGTAVQAVRKICESRRATPALRSAVRALPLRSRSSHK